MQALNSRDGGVDGAGVGAGLIRRSLSLLSGARATKKTRGLPRGVFFRRLSTLVFRRRSGIGRCLFCLGALFLPA